MAKSFLLNIDTNSPSVIKNGNSFQCTVPLVNQHRCVTTVSLKSAEIPIGYYNIRTPDNYLTLSNCLYYTTGSYSSDGLPITSLTLSLSQFGDLTVGDTATMIGIQGPLTYVSHIGQDLTFTISSQVVNLIPQFTAVWFDKYQTTFVVPPGNYTTSTLTPILNSIPTLPGSFSTTTTGQYVFTSTDSNVIQISSNTGVNSVMGFTQSQLNSNIVSSNVVTNNNVFVFTAANTFAISNATGATSYTLAANTYTRTKLLSTISNLPNLFGSFTYEPTTGHIVFTSTDVTKRTLGSITNPNSVLGQLGFTSSQTSSNIVATNSYNFNRDPYLSIWLKNLYTSSSETPLISFKIPAQNVQNGILYYTEGNDFRQVLRITDPNIKLDRIDIEIRDRNNILLNNNNFDWSMTLEITSDT